MVLLKIPALELVFTTIDDATSARIDEGSGGFNAASDVHTVGSCDEWFHIKLVGQVIIHIMRLVFTYFRREQLIYIGNQSATVMYDSAFHLDLIKDQLV